MKKPTIIEISVKAMDNVGVEKEFYFDSMDELKEWWRIPYDYKKKTTGVCNSCDNADVCNFRKKHPDISLEQCDDYSMISRRPKLE